jgi:hypothetical protein
MNCDRLRELLIDYIEGTLAGKDKAEFESHVAHCPECRELIQSFGKLSVSLVDHLDHKASNLQPSPILWGKILSAVQSQKKAARSRGFLKLALTLTSAVVVIAAGVFTPVFGKEGNLLNFISSKVIESASEDLSQMFTPDFKGQVLKAYAVNKIATENGVSQSQIWEMKAGGFSSKDIAAAVFISSKSGRSLDEIIEERATGTGWGKIANQSGISVFAIKQVLANPMEDTTNQILQAKSIDLPVAFNDVENNKILVDSITEPIDLDGIKALDENNSPIELASIDSGDFTMTFDVVDGKLELQKLRLEKPAKPDESKFTVDGKVVSYDGLKLVIETENGNKEVFTVAGETAMHELADAGKEVRVTGFVVGKRLMASSISRSGRMRRLGLGKGNGNGKPPQANQEHQVNPETKNGNGNGIGNGNGKRQNRGEIKPGQQTSDNGQPPKQQITKENNTPSAQNPVVIKSDTLFVAFDRKTSTITTTAGEYKIRPNTSIILDLGNKTEPISLRLLELLNPDAKIYIGGQDEVIQTIIIKQSEFAEVKGWIARAGDGQVVVVRKVDGNWSKQILGMQDWTSVEPSKDLVKPGNQITALTCSGKIVWAKVSIGSFRRLKGKVTSYSSDQIAIDGTEAKIIAGITDFRTDPKDPNPREIKPGMLVHVEAVLIDNQLVAVMIAKIPPPPPDQMRPLKITKVASGGGGKLEITLEDGNIIFANFRMTKVYRDEQDGTKTEMNVNQLKIGDAIVFQLGQQGQMAREITVVRLP